MIEKNEIADGILKKYQPKLSQLLLQNEAMFRDIVEKLGAEEILSLPDDDDDDVSINELFALLSEAVMKDYINLRKTVDVLHQHKILRTVANNMLNELGLL